MMKISLRLINYLAIIILFLFCLATTVYLLSSPSSCFIDSKKTIFNNYKPICTVSGNYLSYQKWNDIDSSWCVTKDGIIIPNTFQKLSKSDFNHEYDYHNERIKKCNIIRKDLNLNQKIIVLLGKIFNTYVS